MHPELRENEFSLLKNLIEYCEKELRKKKIHRDKRVEKEKGQIVINHPSKVLIELSEGRLDNSDVPAMIKRIVRELRELDILYIGRGGTVSYNHRSVALLKLPEDILEQIKKLISNGRLGLVKRRTRRRVRYP